MAGVSYISTELVTILYNLQLRKYLFMQLKLHLENVWSSTAQVYSNLIYW